MQDNPSYKDVVSEISTFLNSQANKAIKLGINKEKIILDLGIGFGKKTVHNLDILKNLNKFSNLVITHFLEQVEKNI